MKSVLSSALILRGVLSPFIFTFRAFRPGVWVISVSDRHIFDP